MASDLSIIVDDSSSDIRYSGLNWQVSGLVQWYGGTSRFPIVGAGSSARQLGSFNMNFEGVLLWIASEKALLSSRA